MHTGVMESLNWNNRKAQGGLEKAGVRRRGGGGGSAGGVGGGEGKDDTLAGAAAGAGGGEAAAASGEGATVDAVLMNAELRALPMNAVCMFVCMYSCMYVCMYECMCMYYVFVCTCIMNADCICMMNAELWALHMHAVCLHVRACMYANVYRI